MAGPGQPQLVAAAAAKQEDSKKRSREEPAESSEHRDGAAEQSAKRGRPDEPETSTCHQGVTTDAAPDRASVEPAADGSPKDAKHQVEDGGAPPGDKEDFEPLPPLPRELQEFASVIPTPIGPAMFLHIPNFTWLSDHGAPSAVEEYGRLGAAAAAVAAQAETAAAAQQPAGTASGAPAAELSMGAPADAQATDLPPPAPLAAAPAPQRGGSAGPPAPSRQESALQPQCAVVMGAALDQEVSTAQLAPLPPREPSQQYHAVAAGLHAALIPPEDTGVSWDHFPNFLGEGTRARLLALATLHLSPQVAEGAAATRAAFPAAVKELPANSNKVLLGAANNCELYQERVIRALAQQAGVPLLVADVYSLKLDEVLKEESAAGAGGLPDDLFGGGSGFPPDPWDFSDEDDPFLGLGLRADRKEAGPGAKDASLDTALAMRKTTARRGMPGMGHYPLGLTGAAQRHPGLANAAAAAAAAHAAAERAAAAAKAARERAAAAKAAAAGTPMPGALPGLGPAPAAAVVGAQHVGGQPAESTARAAAAAGGQPAGDVMAAAQPAAAGAQAAPAAEEQQRPPEQRTDDELMHDFHRMANFSRTMLAAWAVEDASQRLPSDAAAPGNRQTLVTGNAAEVSSAAAATKAQAAPRRAASLILPAASATPAGGPQAGGAAAAAATQAGTSAAASKPSAPTVRRGDRVSYLGRQHPTMASAQERLDQLQAAIQRVELSSSQRARDYLPQLLVRRSLVQAQQSQRIPRVQASGAPPIGSRGRVVGVTGDKVQLALDEPFAGGSTLPGHKEKCGFVCSAAELQVVEDKEDPLVSSLQALFDVVAEVAQKGPLIVFVQNLDHLLRTHATDHFRKLEALLATLPPRCLLFAGYCSRSLARAEAKREGGPTSFSRLFLGGGEGGAFGGAEDFLYDRFGRRTPGQRSKSTKGKLLSKMLPNQLELHPPNQEAHAKAWKKMVEGDVAAMRQRSNRTALRKALAKCGLCCDDWDAVSITDCQLTRKGIEQIVGVAVAQQLAAEGSLAPVPGAGGAAAAGGPGEPMATEVPAAEGKPGPAAVSELGAAADREAAAAMERCDSAEAEAGSTAAAALAVAGMERQQQQQEAQPSAATAHQEPEDAAGPVADGAQHQPSAMQTDEAEAAAAVAAQAEAAGPVATTAAGGIAVDMAAGAEQEGRLQAGAEPAATVAAGGTGTQAAEQEAPPALWTLRAEYVMAAADAVRKVHQEAAAQPEKQALRDVAVDQYEKQLLSEVIPPEEINVSFDDIGALEAVKNTLHEVVILPLQRPELFMRGTLTKPTKGLLLFGPPGTGKTMLAKAVASESGAHFINVNMSAITSKWFGEGERLVRALFGLAHKLSPSVIFVDEIDSFLSKRGQSSNEHEALRKMKNEFMTHWDGLRTKQADRVLVLAATNRPMDLDDAVIRRMPRRIFVPLPDAVNRERILQVILKEEDLDPAFDFKEAAALSDGYSGSDLRNLCIAAAYCPIREYLERERAAKARDKEAAAAAGGQPGSGGDRPGRSVSGISGAAAAVAAAASSATPAALATMTAAAPPQPVRLRPISMADFKEALKQVTASTHADSATTSELQRWNDQYGEGGSRRKEPLAYYT